MIRAPVRAVAAAAVALMALSSCGPVVSEDAPRRLDGSIPARATTRSLLRFAVIGDFGTGTSEQYRVARRMCRWRRHHGYPMVITTGDNIYDYGHPSDFRSSFFRPYACLLNNGVRFHAALGNHDVATRNGRPELNEPAFGMKGRNYVVRAHGVRFVIANSNDMRWRWLRRALRGEPGDRWKIVVFHHPVYSPGEHGSTSGFAPRLPRMFRRRGVDLVLNGHDHIYAPTKPLGRIRYVVTGGGGAGTYDCHPAWFRARCLERHHFLYVVARRGRIVVRAVPPRGRPFHRFSTRGRR